MNFKDIKEKEQEYILHSYGRLDIALDKGENATAYDTEGVKYIDFTSGIGVNSLGFCDKGWLKAITEQAGKIQHMSNYYYNEANVKLAEELSKVTGMSKSFFCNSGAEANECAIKIARKYGEKKGASKIVTLKNSFHGRTLTTLAATGQDYFHESYQPLTEGFVYAEIDNIESVKNQLDNKVCAVMIELVQGEGGVIPADAQFINDLGVLCQGSDILLIVDEVQTGVGRTGKFLACESYGIKPDIVTLAKGLAGGLPIGVCLVNDKLGDIFTPGMNGSTFGANPVVCAGALEVVKRVSDDAFLKEVSEKSSYIKAELEKIPQIDLVRGKGLLIGISVKNADAHKIMVECSKAGLLVLTAKEMIRFLPPLTITKEEIDEGLSIFKKVLSGY